MVPHKQLNPSPNMNPNLALPLNHRCPNSRPVCLLYQWLPAAVFAIHRQTHDPDRWYASLSSLRARVRPVAAQEALVVLVMPVILETHRGISAFRITEMEETHSGLPDILERLPWT